MKYRIIEELFANGKSYLYLQTKGMLWGWNTEQEHYSIHSSFDKSFNSKKDIMEYIKKEKEYKLARTKVGTIIHEI